MAACSRLHRIFEKPFAENPALLESFSSWEQIKPTYTRNESPYANEIFGELHFKEKSVSDTSPGGKGAASASTTSIEFENQKPALDFYSSHPKPCTHSYTTCHRRSDSFSSFNCENLQLCTEGLGFESTDDVEDMTEEMNVNWQVSSEEASSRKNLTSVKQFGERGRRSRSSGAGEFPPPISSIGKPWVSFRSYRHDGRFVLKEIRTPNHEFLHASREDGRLKLRFLHPRDDIVDEESEEEEEEEEEDKEEEVEEEERDQALGDTESIGAEEKQMLELCIK